MKCEIFAILLFVAIVKADYYWRDYHGTIPNDAVIGGRTLDGQPIYIGQAVNQQTKNLVSGQIYKGDKHVTVYHLPDTKSDYFARILCSQKSSEMLWVKTNITHLHLLTECNQIVGGYYEEATLLIGRANYQGAPYIGHIFDYAPKKWQFFITTYRGLRLEFKEFEVLTYGCTKTYKGLSVIAN